MFLLKKKKIKPKKMAKLYNLFVIYVCLFSMCTVYTSNTYSQTPSVAEIVFEKYQTLLLREDIQELLPTILEEIKKPENQRLLIPETINLVVDQPDLLKQFVPNIEDKFITLLKEDQEIQTFLRDSDVQTLLQDIAAIDELAALINMAPLPPAELVFGRYQEFFNREDIMRILPGVLAIFKNPENQKLLQPDTLSIAIGSPDHLNTVLPQIDDNFITLLKDDAEVKAFLSDADVQTLLLDPTEIDKLAVLLEIKVIVSIKPESVESPEVGEQLVITVDITNGFSVSAYEGTIQFDETALKYVSLVHGTYLSGQLLQVNTEVNDNLISFAQVSVDSIGLVAEGTLVTVTFEVLEVKPSMLTLSDVIIGGFGGVSYPVVIEPSEILEPPPKMPWDTNKDGRVNILDLTYVASFFGQENAPQEADVNGDGRINILDLTLVASHFGETY